MGPVALGQVVGQRFGLCCLQRVGGDLQDSSLYLAHGFFGYVRQDHGLVIDVLRGLAADRFEDGDCRVLADLGIEGTHHRVGIHHDLVGRQGNERSSGHGIVGYEHGHLGGVAVQGARDLFGRQYQASRGVQEDVYRHLGRRQPDGPEDLFRVLDVDVPGQGHAEKGQRLLAMDHADETRSPLPLEPAHQPHALGLEHSPAQYGHQGEQDQDQPQPLEHSPSLPRW